MSRTTIMFESLETRRLMSNTLSAGLLHIEGTSVADTVSVYLSAAGDKVVVAHNGVTQSFWKSQVNRLAIGAGGGNNVIAVSPNLTLPATIACGSGNDIISGGSGAETV